MALYAPNLTVVAPDNVVTVGALTVADIIKRVERQFGDESDVQINSTDVIRWINDAQRDIALSANLLQAKGVADVNIGQTDYRMPNDVLTLRSIRVNGIKLDAYSAQEAEELLENGLNETGIPVAFWVWANSINLYPAPNATMVGGLTIYYTRQPTPVAATTDLPEVPTQYHGRIVEYCLQQAYELDENWQAAATKQAQFKQGVDELKANTDWVERDYYPGVTSLASDDW